MRTANEQRSEVITSEETEETMAAEHSVFHLGKVCNYIYNHNIDMSFTLLLWCFFYISVLTHGHVAVQLPLDSLPYVCHPSVSFLPGVSVDLVHLWLIGGSTDKKHGFLLMGHFPDNQLLKRDH